MYAIRSYYALHNPLKYLIMAQVPAFRIPYMNTFMGGPYVLFLRMIGIMSFITRKLFSQHLQNKVNWASFRFPKCIEFFSLKSWYNKGATNPLKSISLKSLIISMVYCISSGVSSGQPMMMVAAGNQWFSLRILAPSLTTLPHSSGENGLVFTLV